MAPTVIGEYDRECNCYNYSSEYHWRGSFTLWHGPMDPNTLANYRHTIRNDCREASTLPISMHKHAYMINYIDPMEINKITNVLGIVDRFAHRHVQTAQLSKLCSRHFQVGSSVEVCASFCVLFCICNTRCCNTIEDVPGETCRWWSLE